MSPPTIKRLIKEATNRVVIEVEKARNVHKDRELKVAWELRSDYLRRLEREINTLGADEPPRTVFISYSRRSGTKYFEYIADLLKDEEFEVLTGFLKHENDENKPLKRVRLQLERSSLYLAIFTKEWQVNLPNQEPQWAPSVWTVEEKGMALALDKPVVLMVEDGIHEDFWSKTVLNRVHHVFSAADYHDAAKSARDALLDRYEDLMIKNAGVS